VGYSKKIQKMRLREKRAERFAFLLNRSGEILFSPFRWVAWRLWGRRRAIRRMRELAGVGESYFRRIDLEREEDRIASHRERLDSIKVPLPTPDPVSDTHDVN
jgi:hypothetical protein